MSLKSIMDIHCFLFQEDINLNINIKGKSVCVLPKDPKARLGYMCSIFC